MKFNFRINTKPAINKLVTIQILLISVGRNNSEATLNN